MAKGKKRDELPRAPRPDTLPTLPSGMEWHEYEAGGYLWTIPEPTSFDGLTAYTRADEAVIVDRFNRGERINRSAKLDIRRKLLDAVKSGKLDETLRTLSQEQIAFDTTAVRPRAVRKAPQVSQTALASAMASGDLGKIQALLAQAGVKVVTE